MKRTKKIEKHIKNIYTNKMQLTTSADLDKKILANSLDTLEELKNKKSAIIRPNAWRIIMKSKIQKFVTVAAVILIAVLGISLLDKSVTPAWAIEDTIRALENIYSIKLLGIATDQSTKVQGKYILWALPNEDGTESAEARFEIPDQQITVVARSGKTYSYQFTENTVYIADYKNLSINPWLGSEFFHVVKKFAKNWKVSYGKDEETDRDSIFATCIHPFEAKSWWFQFDSETRMPVRFKQWTNTNFEGEPGFHAEKIEYNPDLPIGIFEFEIPKGAKVIKLPKKSPGHFDDPNVGVSAEDLTDEGACLMIVEDYLLALIDGDWEYLAQLRPICNAENWELRYKFNENWPTEIAEIGQPSKEDGCNIGPIVPCMVKYSNGQIKNIKLIVKIRNIDGNKSCVIAGTYGSTKDFER